MPDYAFRYSTSGLSVLDHLLERAPITQAGCREWAGARQYNGYGYVWDPGAKRARMVHRLAWEVARGPIPQGMFVLHHCDNPPCIRVTPLRADGTPEPDDHLFLGSHGDNMADAHIKGRMHIGERNGSARLNAERVRAIRRLYEAGTRQHELAVEFGVAQTTISKVVRRIFWPHVD